MTHSSKGNETQEAAPVRNWKSGKAERKLALWLTQHLDPTKCQSAMDQLISVREEIIAAAFAESERSPRETLAAWMVEHSFATGHGDTFEDLLTELSRQIKEGKSPRQNVHGFLIDVSSHTDALWDRSPEDIRFCVAHALEQSQKPVLQEEVDFTLEVSRKHA